MLFGMFLPLLRRLDSRARTLLGVVAVAAGIALIVAWAWLGHGRSELLLIRLGLVLALSGGATFVAAIRSPRRGEQPVAEHRGGPPRV